MPSRNTYPLYLGFSYLGCGVSLHWCSSLLERSSRPVILQNLCAYKPPGKCYSLSCGLTLWTGAHRAPLSMGFSRQESWSGLPCPSPVDLPNPGIEPKSPALQADSLPFEPPGKPNKVKEFTYSKHLKGMFSVKFFSHCAERRQQSLQRALGNRGTGFHSSPHVGSRF